MEWKPEPEVAAVREAAGKIGKGLGATVDRAVLFFTTADGQMGTVSYGADSERCGLARRLGDAIFEAMERRIGKIEDRHFRHALLQINADVPDFGAMAEDVVERLNLLEAAMKHLPDDNARRLMMRDLVMPACELLARFCACVNIEVEGGGDAGAKT